MSEAVATPQDDGRKVFVGNLAFTVDDESLAAYFSAAGEVAQAHVIRRGPRSLGYGFVTFQTERDAILAQSNFNKQLFIDREINVELAKARQEGEARPRRGNFRGGRGGRRGGFGGNNYSMYPAEGGYYQSGYAGRPYRGRRPSRGGRARAPTEGTPSTTTLFVANLPYTMTEEGLANLFSKFKVDKAHIVTMRSGRSKGYGFVEFETEDEQKKALVELSNAVVENRPLSVKIALNAQNGAEAEVQA